MKISDNETDGSEFEEWNEEEYCDTDDTYYSMICSD